MTSFIDDQRETYGVESICTMLPIAPSTYYEQKARVADPSRLPKRTQRDAALCAEIDRVWHENRGIYGARKIWKQLGREDIPVSRCTVERLMGKLALQGIVRGASPRRRSLTMQRHDPWILYNETSRLLGRISCGSRI